MKRCNIPSDLNRTKRAESLHKISQQKLKPFAQHFGTDGDLTIKQIVEEIIKYFMEIVEVLLIQENSNHFLDFMKKSEQMNRELERKMQLLIELKYEELTNLISKQAKEPKINQVIRLDSNADLKKQRKIITKSIINYHRSNSHNIQLKSAQRLPQPSHFKPQIPSVQDIQHDSFQEKDMKTSMQLNSINSQITELEKSQSSAIQQLKKQLQTKIEFNFRDIQRLNQKHLQFKLKFEEKLQENLTALWNVISDIKTSLFNLENLIQK